MYKISSMIIRIFYLGDNYYFKDYKKKVMMLFNSLNTQNKRINKELKIYNKT